MEAQTVQKVLYSRKDAAFALSISLRSVDTLLANKKLAKRRIGGKVLIPASEIRRMARCDTHSMAE